MIKEIKNMLEHFIENIKLRSEESKLSQKRIVFSVRRD